MNIALPAVVVFVLLLPGFIARSRLKRIERLSVDYSPFGQVATEAVVWAGGLHVLWVLLMGWLTPYVFRPEIALTLLSIEPRTQTAALQALARETPAVTLYFGSLLAFAYLGPLGMRRLITWRRWDRVGSPLSGLLRFSAAPWYYLLSGADFAEDECPDLIAISAIVNVSGDPFLYTGVLEDYYLDAEGQLDRLILSQVMRRPLGKDKPAGDAPAAGERFYAVDGDYFVLRYAEAVTLNVEYILLAEAEGSTGETPDDDTPAADADRDAAANGSR
jgi:hypothetical protein